MQGGSWKPCSIDSIDRIRAGAGARAVSEPDKKMRADLAEALGLKAKEVISLAGGGGKTTLMFRLARELVLSGQSVVTTTTTRILEPTSEETPCFFVHRDGARIKEFVKRHIEEFRHVTLAGERLESKKVKGVDPSLIVDLWDLSLCNYIIVEADGAAGKPVKAPREQEPVIPVNTTVFIAIVGIDSVGLELNENNVFQPERISRLTGSPLGKKLSIEALATLITHPQGVLKGAPILSRGVVLLNKVDLPNGRSRAQELAERVLEKKHPQIERIVLGQLQRDPPVAEVIFPC